MQGQVAKPCQRKQGKRCDENPERFERPACAPTGFTRLEEAEENDKCRRLGRPEIGPVQPANAQDQSGCDDPAPSPLGHRIQVTVPDPKDGQWNQPDVPFVKPDLKEKAKPGRDQPQSLRRIARDKMIDQEEAQCMPDRTDDRFADQGTIGEPQSERSRVQDERPIADHNVAAGNSAEQHLRADAELKAVVTCSLK